MLPRIVSDWIEPFSEARFRKPAGWAEHLRPAAPAACTMPAAGPLDAAIGRAQVALLRQQNPDDGFWCGDLRRGDTTVECDTITLLNFVGQGDSPKVADLARTILAAQLPDGGWPIYVNGSADVSATVKAYWALKFAGFAPEHPALRRGALAAHQGDPPPRRLVREEPGRPCRRLGLPVPQRLLKGQGPATVSQTAWALLGLMAAGRGETSVVARGISHLLMTQRADGTWDEEPCTGTGFPSAYYLTYGLYRDYFPLMALGLFRRMLVAPQVVAGERDFGAASHATTRCNKAGTSPRHAKSDGSVVASFMRKRDVQGGGMSGEARGPSTSP